jgi:hypothetical protein
METRVAFGREVGSELFGQEAWRLCACEAFVYDVSSEVVRVSYRYRITVND